MRAEIAASLEIASSLGESPNFRRAKAAAEAGDRESAAAAGGGRRAGGQRALARRLSAKELEALEAKLNAAEAPGDVALPPGYAVRPTVATRQVCALLG